MRLPDGIRFALAKALGTSDLRFEPVAGGTFGAVRRVRSAQADGLLKTLPAAHADRLEAESDGLRALAVAATSRRVASVRIPAVLGCGVEDGVAYLATEWVQALSWSRADVAAAGRGLAELHRAVGSDFGWRRDNFLGASEQANEAHDSWAVFFIERRLVPQRRMLEAGGRWDPAWSDRWDRLVRGTAELLGHAPAPSLVHGDLWSGNVLPTAAGAALIDPAVHHADREVDLAMAALFGGVPAGFFDAYEEAWPRPPGWRDRARCYDLYHMMNHLTLFGGGYAGAVDRLVRRLT